VRNVNIKFEKDIFDRRKTRCDGNDRNNLRCGQLKKKNSYLNDIIYRACYSKLLTLILWYL